LGDCLLWVIYVKITDVEQIIRLLFHYKSCVLHFKKCIGLHFVRFFHASGHPVRLRSLSDAKVFVRSGQPIFLMTEKRRLATNRGQIQVLS
jgi:hypothetical protein